MVAKCGLLMDLMLMCLLSMLKLNLLLKIKELLHLLLKKEVKVSHVLKNLINWA